MEGVLKLFAALMCRRQNETAEPSGSLDAGKCIGAVAASSLAAQVTLSLGAKKEEMKRS